MGIKVTSSKDTLHIKRVDDGEPDTVFTAAVQVIEACGANSEDPVLKRKVQAIIKRHVHHEKLSVYFRLKMYMLPLGYVSKKKGQDPTDEEKVEMWDWMMKHAFDDKIETHRKFTTCPIEEVITWKDDDPTECTCRRDQEKLFRKKCPKHYKGKEL